MSSILNEMRFNTNKTLAKIDHYMGADPVMHGVFNSLTGNGMTLAVAGILIGCGAIIASPVAATAATIAVGAVGASALIGGTGMAVFGKMWNAIRGSKINLEKGIQEDLATPVEVVNKEGQIVSITTRQLYGKLENGEFYEEYKGVIDPAHKALKELVPTENIMINPGNVRSYLASVKGIYNDQTLDEQEKAIGKVMAMDSKSAVLNKIGKIRQFSEAYDQRKKNTI